MASVDVNVGVRGEYKGIIRRWPCCISISTGHKGLLSTGLIINPHYLQTILDILAQGRAIRCHFSARYSAACAASSRKNTTKCVYFLKRLESTATSHQSRWSMCIKGKPHREQGVKNGKKFHHQKAKRRTCSEEQGRREAAAGGIPLHGNAAFCSQKEDWKKNRVMSSQASLGSKHVQSCSFSVGFMLWD